MIKFLSGWPTRVLIDMEATVSSGLPTVAILMCTYNGARFLREQLESLQLQTHQNWVLIVSDDGSSDQTIDILQQHKSQWPPGKLTIQIGPKKGFCQNFLSLACDPKIQADYYAFCDQDDVWLPNKLEVSLKKIILNQVPKVPYLYCGRTQYVTANLKPCGKSPLFVFPPCFRNALVQSIAGGNTMVFNDAAKKIIEEAGVLDVPSHDWWVYQLVSGVDGHIFYNNEASVLYRQHEDALVGGNRSLFSKVERAWKLFQGSFQHWNTQNITALKQVNHLLAEHNQETLRMFEVLRGAKLKDRLRLLGICGLYRQTRRGTLSLFLATLIKKI